MGFNGSGTFLRKQNWQRDAATGVPIKADLHDDEDDNFAAGLTNCITKDGQTQPDANIPMNQKKIVNHGLTVKEDAPSTVATKSYVDGFKEYQEGLLITGANYPNGMVTYKATTGMTGLAFANTDMSWLSKPVDPSKFPARLVATNSSTATTGKEVFTIDRLGNISNDTGTFAYNMSYDDADGVKKWRVNTTGVGTLLKLASSAFAIQYNEPATVQNNQIGVIKNLLSVDKASLTYAGDPNAIATLNKKDGTGGYTSRIVGGTWATGARWSMDLGNSTVESGGTTGTTGSDFSVLAYDNSGGAARNAMNIVRSSLEATFAGNIRVNQNVQSTATNIVVAGAGGSVFLRPNGAGSAFGDAVLDTNGNFILSTGNLYVNNTNAGSYLGLGQQGRAGMYGSYTGGWHNWQYAGDGYLYAYVNNTAIGAVQMVCDHRTKRDVAPLGSTWNMVKALQPISYKYKGIPELLPGDTDQDEERWGFVAHELQEKLLPSAASFTKDAPDKIQSPNLMAVVAALTKALQEAQARIEALEARLP